MKLENQERYKILFGEHWETSDAGGYISIKTDLSEKYNCKPSLQISLCFVFSSFVLIMCSGEVVFRRSEDSKVLHCLHHDRLLQPTHFFN
jgi:hypothetical protein